MYLSIQRTNQGGLARYIVPDTDLGIDIGTPSLRIGTLYANDVAISGQAETLNLFVKGVNVTEDHVEVKALAQKQEENATQIQAVESQQVDVSSAISTISNNESSDNALLDSVNAAHAANHTELEPLRQYALPSSQTLSWLLLSGQWGIEYYVGVMVTREANRVSLTFPRLSEYGFGTPPTDIYAYFPPGIIPAFDSSQTIMVINDGVRVPGNALFSATDGRIRIVVGMDQPFTSTSEPFGFERFTATCEVRV